MKCGVDPGENECQSRVDRIEQVTCYGHCPPDSFPSRLHWYTFRKREYTLPGMIPYLEIEIKGQTVYTYETEGQK